MMMYAREHTLKGTQDPGHKTQATNENLKLIAQKTESCVSMHLGWHPKFQGVTWLPAKLLNHQWFGS